MKPISLSEREDIDRILAAHGYRPDDFDASTEADPSPAHGPIIVYAIRSTVTVRRKNTGQAHQYRDIPFSAWLIDGFQRDLEGGLFGKP